MHPLGDTSYIYKISVNRLEYELLKDNSNNIINSYIMINNK